MSRVAKNPVVLPVDVEVVMSDAEITVKGKLGVMKVSAFDGVTISHQNGNVSFSWDNDDREAHAMSGTLRALVNNAVVGVSAGFERKLTLIGVGYRAQAQGTNLNLTLGFSHPVLFPVPEGIKIETPSQTEIVIRGVDKQLVGQVAAKIRAYRPPEPYKGKGVRYSDEVVVIKETKKK